MLTDQELLARYRKGDASAFDCLVDRHGATVYSYVRRFLGVRSSVVDDVTQEVWLRVIRHSHAFDGRARFTTWMFSVTRNTCIDHLRKQKRRAGVIGGTEEGDPFRIEDLAARGPSVIDRLARAELVRFLEQAVQELPDSQREVFLLREQTDLTFREIGGVLGIKVDTVKSRMRYALGHIRRTLRAFCAREVPAREL